MCGIAGIISETGGLLEAQLAPMIEAQAHRGPDAWGVWSDERCALGHRRLSIIDLSEAGRQPMANTDGGVLITFNGEIYNFQQLRRELEGLGHNFRTRTDTEAIIYAYEQWGVDCLARLRGMFAIGIWDRKRRRLFLARDRVGKKPLFYAQFGGRFLFASELQGILADKDVPREVDPRAIDAYLSYGYVPAPRTAFKGVYKLPPAHYLTLDLKQSGFEKHIERYWSLDYGPKIRISEEEACEVLREKMCEAVRLRMISDVPLGAFLSGGIDSSVVVGLMAKVSGAKVKTFSIGFNEAAYDETAHARRIAERWETDHHEFIVEPDALSILPKLVRHYGEPYADSSAIPTFYVAQMTRRHVTVALNGDGGDESFAGYERYLANYLAERLQSVPGMATAARALGRVIPDSIDPKSRARQARRFLAVASRPMAERYPRWLKTFQDEAKPRLYSPEFSVQLNGHADESLESLFNGSPVSGTPTHPVDAAMAVDVASYLPYDLLVKVDITSMANSLEARSPFLDHEVMEFAARLPVEIKFRDRRLKHLLKRAFADLLPPENVNRRKMGFGVPVGQWFRGPLRELLRETLFSQQSLGRGYFREPEVRRLVDEHLDSAADHSFQLWNLLMLELWHREFEVGQ
ncbi:MAG TPA: asparagine synthase (glutamine-hydrolyzing) [Blastocatellia bacterium]|nr:asparagine synthase (glutamine-hydrolyzing) [Blastocatellia bacterium]